ncbi:hypothetical protein AVEN_93499-1 [Araneus ventricosus]|uniref:Uncharacterized protein n=1 Tax=Araneus ventricosus TaxID=182803 RepID=A0A4Y2AR99_ARAVE|nr:hypothetical protein AVEN_93499-1 [Araneus ventricosus]
MKQIISLCSLFNESEMSTFDFTCLVAPRRGEEWLEISDPNAPCIRLNGIDLFHGSTPLLRASTPSSRKIFSLAECAYHTRQAAEGNVEDILRPIKISGSFNQRECLDSFICYSWVIELADSLVIGIIVIPQIAHKNLKSFM